MAYIISIINSLYITLKTESTKGIFSLNTILVSSMLMGTENPSMIILINFAFILILGILFLKSIKITYNSYSGKITNWYYTYIIASIYTLSYIGFILFLRIWFINNPINLKNYWNLILNLSHNIYQNNSYQNIIFGELVINFILLLFFVMKIIQLMHKHYRMELVKLHLYHQGRHKLLNLKSSFYNEFIKKIHGKWGFHHFRFVIGVNFTSFTGLNILAKLSESFKNKLDQFNAYLITKYFTDYLPFTAGILILFYDCLMHNFVLLWFMYYLPIFFLLVLWIQYSAFIMCYDLQFTNILFELYYRYPTIIYINIPKTTHQQFANYLNNFLNLPQTYTPTFEDFCNVNPLQTFHRFQKIENTYFYFNKRTEIEFHWCNLKLTKNGYFLKNFEKLTKKTTSMETYKANSQFFIFTNDIN